SCAARYSTENTPSASRAASLSGTPHQAHYSITIGTNRAPCWLDPSPIGPPHAISSKEETRNSRIGVGQLCRFSPQIDRLTKYTIYWLTPLLSLQRYPKACRKRWESLS